jgi:hypothetical protein
MPACKSDITISIHIGEKSFTIGGLRLMNGQYKIKRGRSWSQKTPLATMSEIFAEARKWAVKNA